MERLVSIKQLQLQIDSMNSAATHALSASSAIQDLAGKSAVDKVELLSGMFLDEHANKSRAADAGEEISQRLKEVHTVLKKILTEENVNGNGSARNSLDKSIRLFSTNSASSFSSPRPLSQIVKGEGGDINVLGTAQEVARLFNTWDEVVSQALEIDLGQEYMSTLLKTKRLAGEYAKSKAATRGEAQEVGPQVCSKEEGGGRHLEKCE